MFLKLYWLGAALALMPLPTQPRKVHSEELFLYVPKEINKDTFPVNLNVITNSNMILVKCPNFAYHHTNGDDEFEPNFEIFKNESILTSNADLFAWVPLLRAESEPTELNCGEILFNGSKDHFNWIFNFTWINGIHDGNFTKQEKYDDKVPNVPKSCVEAYHEKLIIFSSKKKGGFSLITKTEYFKDYYFNQMFYYFEKVDEKEETMRPCGIVKIYSDAPTIKVKPFESTSEAQKVGNYYKIDLLETGQQTIEVVLDLDGNLKYYEEEALTLKKMKYDKEQIKVIESSNTLITSNFTINGYGILQLTFNYQRADGHDEASKIYYFGPQSKDYIIKEDTIKYLKNDISSKPKCYIHYLDIGYLDKVDYNGIEGSYQTLISTDGIKGKFKINLNSVIFDENEDGKTTVKCTYKTLDGKITTITTFVNVDINALFEKNKREHIFKFEGIARLKLEELEKKRQEEKKEKYRKLESNKSLYEKLSYKVGNTCAILIIVDVILFILFILYFPLKIIYVKFLSPFLKMLKNKKKYPNVYVFWNNLTNQSFHNYCMAIKDKRYLSMKMLHPAFLKAIKTDDEVDIMISNIFDDTLVHCHKNLPEKLQAHYVYTDAEERRYILSDGPRKDNQCSFWQMIYEEDIATIIAIIYDKKSKENDQALKNLYWKTDKRTYGDITVGHYKKIPENIPSVTGYQILLERKGDESKSLTIYHAFNWKENDLPQSDFQFVSIYKEILEVAPKKNILIHSSQGTGARVYMITYFACIYDAFMSNGESFCPLTIIKGIRDKRYGGNLVSYEFAYIIKALVTTLFNSNILVDFSTRLSDFTSSYDNYFYEYLKRREQMGDELKEFLNFVNIIDKGKIYEYKSVFYTLGRIEPIIIPNYCKRFQNAIDNFLGGKDKKKCRYKNIQCLDSSGVTVNGKLETDKDSFIHANMFEYTTKNNKKRKMILCQAPLVDTIDDMLDMILRYKINVIIILIRPEEASASEKNWFPYFLEKHQVFETSNFCVSKLKFKELDKGFTTETECLLRSKENRSETKFTILHYHEWPDKSIPSEHMSIYSLYKRIISLRTDDYIAIYCNSGIGGTGTLALTIYLIDTINYFPTFDPIERLRCLREHRYLAVQRFSQFVFALLVVFEHHKEKIIEMDSEAYDNFLKIAKNVLKKEKELENKQK